MVCRGTESTTRGKVVVVILKYGLPTVRGPLPPASSPVATAVQDSSSPFVSAFRLPFYDVDVKVEKGNMEGKQGPQFDFELCASGILDGRGSFTV